MTKSDAIKYFGSGSKLAAQLGVTRQAVSNWPEELPPGRQFQIQVLTNGALTATQHTSNQEKETAHVCR